MLRPLRPPPRFATNWGVTRCRQSHLSELLESGHFRRRETVVPIYNEHLAIARHDINRRPGLRLAHCPLARGGGVPDASHEA